MMAVPKMRGLREAVDELHARDSGCALSFYALRSLVADGSIPCVRVGRRVLVNMEVLYDYLRAPASACSDPVGRSVKHIG